MISNTYARTNSSTSRSSNIPTSYKRIVSSLLLLLLLLLSLHKVKIYTYTIFDCCVSKDEIEFSIIIIIISTDIGGNGKGYKKR